MLLSGIVGLFVGAVVLVLGYELIEFWVVGDVAVNHSTGSDTSSDASE